MKNTFCTFLLTATALFCGCTDDDNAVTPAPAANIYSPLTAGSTWTYESSGGIISKDSVIGTTTIDGRQYVDIFKRIENPVTPLTYTESYRTNNDTLFLLADGGEEVVLIARPNAVWTSSVSNATFSQNDTSTVVESGISHTVNGTVYSNVVHVHQVNTVLLQGNSTATQYDLYYAKNIGLIEQINPGLIVRLKSYSIK